jgi:hypothetical protein
MERLRRHFRPVVAAFNGVMALVYVLWRWQSRGSRPHLVFESIRAPYWGGAELPVVVRNIGTSPARECRYCRYQRFTMSGKPPSAATCWYVTEAFKAPVDGHEQRQTAFATRDACPRIALQDLLGSGETDSSATHAIVCRDRFGTHYRFRLNLGADAQPDVWRWTVMDHLLRRAPPMWTRWAECPRAVETREWSAQFSH